MYLALQTVGEQLAHAAEAAAQRIEVMSQCGVAHVGGDLYRAVLAVIGGVFRRRALFVCGQRAYEAAERLRVHLSAKAGEQTVGREGLRGERGKARGVFAGICLKVRSKIGR